MKNSERDQQIRDDLLAKASTGDMTPDQAEAEADRRGMSPLASVPPKDQFDPMAQSHWTLLMAIAWIAYRTPESVRHVWNDYRKECWDWRESAYWVTPKGPTRKGWILEQRKPATFPRFAVSMLIDRARGETSKMSPRDAQHALWAALSEDLLPASGRLDGAGRELIAPLQWLELKPVEDRLGTDEVRTQLLSRGFRDVLVPSRGVVRLWPVDKPRPALPEVMPPTGDGHMPIFCVALWIATKGGSFNFDPDETALWEAAYDELTRAISSDKVHVIGLRGGVREPVPGYIFAACQVDYPYCDAPLELLLGEELYLRSYPYVDEEHWRKGFDDALINRREDRWTQLLASRMDVRSVWPFDSELATVKRGAAGRPTSMHLVHDELERRVVARQLEPTLAAEAGVLLDWLRTTHPLVERPTIKTIKNRIGSRFRAAKAVPK